jgi:hypothetical protein
MNYNDSEGDPQYASHVCIENTHLNTAQEQELYV